MQSDCKSNNIIVVVFQSTGGTFCPIFRAYLTLTPTPRDLTTQMLNSGILHALPNLVILFNCLAFPKVTTFTCSFGACDVNVSVFNMSFSGAGVRGPGLVRATEGADWHRRSILSRPSVIFPAWRSFFDPSGLINEPTVYSLGCRATVAAEGMCHCTARTIWQAGGAKARENNKIKQLTSSFSWST